MEIPLKKRNKESCPLSDSQMCFVSSVGFEVSLVSHGRRLYTDDDPVSHWLILSRPQTGPLLIRSHPQAELPLSPPSPSPSLSLSLSNCFLCIETVCCSLSLCRSQKDSHSVYSQIRRLLWRSQDVHLESLCVGVEGGRRLILATRKYICLACKKIKQTA